MTPATAARHARAPARRTALGWSAAEARALMSATTVQAGRVLRRSMRIRPVLVQTLVFPVVLMLVLLAAFDKISTDAAGGGQSVAYVQRLVPLMVLTSALFGGLGSGASLVSERDSGLLARFATLPAQQVSVLLGRVVGDIGRMLVGAAVLVAAGHLVGFRFERGAVGAVGFFVLAAVYGSAFTWLVVAVAIRARSYESVMALTPVLLVLLFFNTGFVALADYPDAVQPFVRVAPHTWAVRAMVGLTHSGPIVGPIAATLAWSALIGGTSAFVARRRFASLAYTN